MRRAAVRKIATALVLALIATLALTVTNTRAAGEPPAWAYAIPPAPPAGTPPPTPPPPDTTPKTLPGSNLTFTRQQIANGFGPADWFPGDHPPMPEIVAKGKQAQNARACGLCHMPNGKGRQENAGVSGLPVSYFIQTMNDFRNDLRKSAEPRKANTNAMIQIAKAMTPEEIKIAAVRPVASIRCVPRGWPMRRFVSSWPLRRVPAEAAAHQLVAPWTDRSRSPAWPIAHRACPHGRGESPHERTRRPVWTAPCRHACPRAPARAWPSQA
jgi:cytochrome c553